MVGLAARITEIEQRFERSFGEDRRQTISARDLPSGLQANLPPAPPEHFTEEASEAGDVASISTATEDDPVNLAMHATMADGSSVADDDDRSAFTEDEEAEEIMWPVRGRQSSTPLRDDFNAPATPTLRTSGEARQSFGSGGNTSSDLLHNLMTSNINQTPQQSQSPPAGKATASPLGDTASPILFGGGGFPSSSSIWTRDVNEMDGQFARSKSGSGFARAGSVTNAHGLPGWNAGATGRSPSDGQGDPPVGKRNLASSLFPPHPA